MQEALNSLSLQPHEEVEEVWSNKVLLGKILTTRSFRRFTITEIAQKTWKTLLRSIVEKTDENLFKFTFGIREDRDHIFKGRPWLFNGAHLILKESTMDRGLKEISFQYSTFTLQIHGLPPFYMHEGSARKIGELVGIVHSESINKRSVTANRFLKLRVDINVEEPIPAGFFQEGEERWFQFKYDRLGDFCYNCGMLAHVTGRCNKGLSATITTCNRISAKLYGSWLRSEHNGSLLFVNIPEEGEEADWQGMVVKESTVANLMRQIAKSPQLGESME